jgi:phytanoyl-CoA hydroxylase
MPPRSGDAGGDHEDPAVTDRFYTSPVLSFLKRKRNPGLIWLDTGEANRAIAEKRNGAAITDEEAQNLRKFASDGYCITHVDLPAADAKQIDADVDALWARRPENVSFAYDSPPKRFSAADEQQDRKPRYRIHELHTASDTVLRLVLHPLLHRYAALILGETAIATQSLYFEYGSQQALHRDSTIVPTPEFGRLVAAWIALEDITPESGPLAYVPGSHKFPFHAMRPGEYVYNPAVHTADDVASAVTFYEDQLKRSKLPTRHFLARRGDVLIWHSALMHGGAQPVTPERTRKSLVVHYSTLRNHPTRLCAVHEDGGDSVFETDKMIERDGTYTFANPLEGKFLYRR